MQLTFRGRTLSLPDWITIEIDPRADLDEVWSRLIPYGISADFHKIAPEPPRTITITAADLATMPDLRLERKDDKSIRLAFWGSKAENIIDLAVDPDSTVDEVYLALEREGFMDPMIRVIETPLKGGPFPFKEHYQRGTFHLIFSVRLIRLRPDNEARILSYNLKDVPNWDSLYLRLAEEGYSDHIIPAFGGGDRSPADTLRQISPLVRPADYQLYRELFRRDRDNLATLRLARLPELMAEAMRKRDEEQEIMSQLEELRNSKIRQGFTWEAKTLDDRIYAVKLRRDIQNQVLGYLVREEAELRKQLSPMGSSAAASSSGGLRF